MIFIRCPFATNFKCLQIENNVVQSELIRSQICDKLGTDDFLLYCNGSKLASGQNVQDGSIVCVALTLPGGKGGFGSMLRAIGAQIEKTTNREACRDLSGRRLRDINEEQRLKRWISKEGEREAEKARRRKEKIERLKSQPKHHFVDFAYEKEMSEIPERVDDAVRQGMQLQLQKEKSALVKKRKPSGPSCSPKRHCKWFGLDDISSESETSDTESPHPVKDDKSSEKETSDLSVLEEQSSNDSEDQKLIDIDNSSSEQKSSHSYQGMSHNDGFKQPVNIDEDVMDGAPDFKTAVEYQKNLPGSSKAPPLDPLPPPTQQDKELIQDEPTIDLLKYNNLAELESLGLDRLKAALRTRGLKCGGTLTDRAQRLWKIRDLQPHEFPAILLAKVKKN